ncbi:MAG: NAD-dependent protein deacetylase [Chlamydiae bacterium]|nr:NAD-dependent protein deacetylase [Chlamydiota bacterium]
MKIFISFFLILASSIFADFESKSIDMCWQFGSDSYFRFDSQNEEVYFEIVLGNLPEFYDDFIAQKKDKFIELDQKQLFYSYGTREESVKPQRYLLCERRVIEDANPQFLKSEALEKVICENRVLFYTGAGISRASNVPSMDELNVLLGFEEGERFVFSLEEAIEHPEEFALKILAFHRACVFSPPTKAHITLKGLAAKNAAHVVTENLDCLHERSGIFPYRVDPSSGVRWEKLTQVDYVICMGLSYDDRGFLGFYKQNHPEGKIIAIDLEKPSYLGDEDFLVIGDLQEIIPSLRSLEKQESVAEIGDEFRR